MVYTRDGAQIHYHLIGEGRPVVLLHGFGCDHRLMTGCMEPVFRRQTGYRRVYVDLPGMGQSRAPVGMASADAVLELLLHFLDECVGDPFLLAGESYGGYLARGILARRPERVEGLLLLCPVVEPEQARRTLPDGDVRLYDRAYLERFSKEELRGLCEYAVTADKGVHARYRRDVQPGIEAADRAFTASLRQQYRFSFDMDEEIGKAGFERPALFVAGRQDRCVGYKDLWELVGDYPRATYAVLDLTGHNLQLEQPALFEHLAENWLQRVELQGQVHPSY